MLNHTNANHDSRRFLWLAVYAGMLIFVGGRWNLPLAAWLAPVFAIRFYRTSEHAWRDFLWLWLATALPTIVGWHGATAIRHIHPVAEPLFFVATTPIALIPYALDRRFARRFAPSLWLTLVFPVAFTAVDFFSATGSPFGSFGASAYAQRDVTWLMQLGAVTGLWGIPFIISWFASVANFAWEAAFRWQRIGRVVLVYAGVLAVVIGFGAARLLWAPPAQTTVWVAGFSLPGTQVTDLMMQLGRGDERGFEEATRALHADQLAQIRSAAEEGAQIVVLQEGAGLGFSADVERLLADASNLARQEQVYIVLPTFAIDPTSQMQPENSVHIIDPNGAVVLTHTKFGGTQFEGSLTGSGVLQTVDTPFGRLSAVICWDADFPDVMRQAGEQGVDLMFVPANDWYELRDIHAGMATFRAVENGMAIFRQTGAGVSLVTDAYGRIISRVDGFADGNETGLAIQQMVLTPATGTDTLYPVVGDSFGLAMQVGLVGLLATLWFTRRRPVIGGQRTVSKCQLHQI